MFKFFISGALRVLTLFDLGNIEQTRAFPLFLGSVETSTGGAFCP